MSNKVFEEENYIISIIDGYTLDIFIKDFMELQKEDIINMQSWVKVTTDEKKLMNLVRFGNGSTVTREAREYASSPEGNVLTIGSAILVKNLAQQLIIDYYIKFNKPVYPTRVFYKKDKAVRWIEEQIAIA